MTGFSPFHEARCAIDSIVRSDSPVTVSPEHVTRLAPCISGSRACSVTLMRNSLSDADLFRLLWIEVALRDPKPRPEIVRRILGRIHTRERRRVMAVCLRDGIGEEALLG